MSKIDNEVCAVLTAAVAAMSTNKGYSLVVKSFRRVPQSSPVWNTAGRIERLRDSLNVR